LLLCIVLAINGCAYQMASEKDRLLSSARYGELERHMEAEVPQLPSAPTEKLFPLCLAYSKVKRYNKLFPCLEQLEANIRLGDKYDVFHTVFLLKSDISPMPSLLRAEAYLELGQYERAIEEAMKVDRPFPEATTTGFYSETSLRIQALTILALAHAFAGDRAKALEYRDRLKDWPVEFMGSAFKLAEKRNGLAKVHVALGDCKTALEYLRDLGGWFRDLGDALVGASAAGQSVFSFVELPKLYMLNKCLLDTGDLARARGGYDQLLRVPQTSANGEIYWLILFDRGRIAEQDGRLEDAVGFYRRAIDVIEQQRASINTEANKIGFVGNKQAVYRHLIATLFTSGQHTAAFEYVERSKSRTLVDLLAGKRDFAVRTGSAERVQALLATLETAEVEARVQEAAAPSGSERRSLIARTKQELREQAPDLASLTSVTFVSAAEIQSRIASNEALIEYYYADGEMFAFILTAQGVRAIQLNGDNLPADIRRLREALEDPTSRGHLEMSQALYQRLWRPLGSLASTPHLIIIPHGALHYLPFNALHDGTAYLVDRFSIRLLPSASVMRYLRATRTEKPTGMLAFGNPALGDPRYNLRYAQAEAVAVGDMFPRSRVLVREQATETALKRWGDEFPYIHFATHGEFDSDAPLRSALLLAPDAESDGVLTVGKLYSLRLDADLITLSACETGLGKITNGDDVVGLTRGFLYAGTSSIVASLWKVDDLATSHLMSQFYSALRGADKREALRQAQLEARRKYPHPYYWAAFQLTGNAR
jgi:CHAT domain-containing protein